mmetsp:Transcript_20474/g.36772  ORF Transcript_20474/g.36772 Transcript_20474/m.36772 type:complete len:297 (-) Transcript_20474:66-956(-)
MRCLLLLLDVFECRRWVCPQWHLDFLKGVIWQREEVSHGKDEGSNIFQERGVMTHVGRCNQHSPAGDGSVDPTTMFWRDQTILHAMDDERGTPDPWSKAQIREAIFYDVGKPSNLPLEEILDSCERADEDYPSNVVLCCQHNCGTSTERSPEELHTITWPVQGLCDKLHCSSCICNNPSLIRRALTNAITWILYSQYMNLEQVAEDLAETVAQTKVLGVCMKVDEDEPSMTKRQEDARDLQTIFPGYQDELPRKAIDGVRWRWGWKNKPFDWIPTGRIGRQHNPHHSIGRLARSGR